MPANLGEPLAVTVVASAQEGPQSSSRAAALPGRMALSPWGPSGSGSPAAPPCPAHRCGADPRWRARVAVARRRAARPASGIALGGVDAVPRSAPYQFAATPRNTSNDICTNIRLMQIDIRPTSDVVLALCEAHSIRMVRHNERRESCRCLRRVRRGRCPSRPQRLPHLAGADEYHGGGSGTANQPTNRARNDRRWPAPGSACGDRVPRVPQLAARGMVCRRRTPSAPAQDEVRTLTRIVTSTIRVSRSHRPEARAPVHEQGTRG